MIVYEITNTEANPVYRTFEVENGERQYGFLKSVVAASFGLGRPFLSQHVIKALNFHAIACLHISAGEFRPHDVRVGPHIPITFVRVQSAMDDFVNRVNRYWEVTDAVTLATYVLWRLNNIHPFVNGNGRTARAASYFVLCLKLGGRPPGDPILPELIKRERDEYCMHLQHAHDTFIASGEPDLAPLHGLVSRLLAEQLASATPSVAIDPAAAPTAPTAPSNSPLATSSPNTDVK